MIVFSGPLPLPGIKRMMPSSSNHNPLPSIHRLKLSNDALPTFDYSTDYDDDEDDDEFPIQLDVEDEYMDGVLRQDSAKSSLAKVTESKKTLSSPLAKVPMIKKPVKVVPKRPIKLDCKVSKGSNMKSLERSVKPLDYGLSGLSFGTWEERAYEFVRKKKLRESMDATEQNAKKTDAAQQNTTKTVIEPCSHVPVVRNAGPTAGLELHKRCEALVEYLLSLGLQEEQLKRIAKRRKACFYVSVSKARERLDYLKSLGLTAEDLIRIIQRHPRVLEYTVERMMKPRVQYLQSIGVPDAKLGKAVTATPSLLECSLERSLKPRVRFFVEEVGISASDVWKVVVLSPQVLTQNLDDSLRPRLSYLLKTLGMSQERVAKMIMKHPQLLHYSIKYGIEPKIEFLRSIGMSDVEIFKVLGRSSQILSLSVEKSLKPKSEYLLKELECGVQAVTSFPAYFSLSLEQRIRPRHKFLKALNKLPPGPFPLRLFALTDQEFCERLAKSTVEEYNAFRQSMLLHGFAKKLELRSSLHYDKVKVK